MYERIEIVDTITFKQNGKSYPFLSIKDKDGCFPHIRDSSYKELHYGYFPEDAPEGCKPGYKYILRKIRAKSPFTDTCAGTRDIFDIVPFRGEHICPILSMDDNAAKVNRMLEENPFDIGKGDCADIYTMVIVPKGKPYREILEEGDLTPGDVLDSLLQMAQAIRELVGQEVCNRRILAYRDVKVGNFVFFKRKDTGRYCVKLIDHATIYLDSDPNKKSLGIRKGTLPCPISWENTVLEDVSNDYKVSDKTDAFGLGMLLGQFFLESHQSLNDLWLRRVAWKRGLKFEDKIKEDTRVIRDTIVNAYNTYDRHNYSPDEPSWLERIVAEQEGGEEALKWTTDCDPHLLKGIRRLFRASIRIRPEDRLSPDEFIKELEKLIAEAKGMDPEDPTDTAPDGDEPEEVHPVDIYLVDRTNLGKYRLSYLRSAVKNFEETWTSYEEEGSVPPRVVCATYAQPPVDSPIADYISVQGPLPCCSKDELWDLFERIPSERARSGKSIMLYGIQKALNVMAKRGSLSFTGSIHVFTPCPVEEEEILPFKTKLSCQSYDLDQYTSRIMQVSIDGIKIVLHSPKDGGHAWWDEWVKLPSPPDDYGTEDFEALDPEDYGRSEREEVVEEPEKPEDPVPPVPEEPEVPVYYREPGGLFIRDEDGVPHYIERIVKPHETSKQK